MKTCAKGYNTNVIVKNERERENDWMEEGRGPDGEGGERILGGGEEGMEKRDTMARFSTPIRLSPPTT